MSEKFGNVVSLLDNKPKELPEKCCVKCHYSSEMPIQPDLVKRYACHFGPPVFQLAMTPQGLMPGFGPTNVQPTSFCHQFRAKESAPILSG